MMWFEFEGVPERFDSKVTRSGDCLVWTRSTAGNGYGTFRLSRPTRRYVYAHRLALERKIGRPLAVGERALHSCDNPPCVNPDHLRVGDQHDNMADASARGRTLRGESGTKTKLTEREVLQILALLRMPDANQTEIAARYGVSRPAIGMIKAGKTWAYLPR